MSRPNPIFIGVDPHERAATNVMIDSLSQHRTIPLAITPLVTAQLEAQQLYWPPRGPEQSTTFSFTRVLVPHLMAYQDRAIFWTATCSPAAALPSLGRCAMSSSPCSAFSTSMCLANP